MSEIYTLFDSLPTAPVGVVNRPVGGTRYIYRWADTSKGEDWRSDGYRWRQSGTMTIKTSAGPLKKTYFQVCCIGLLVYVIIPID